ncbi:MAG: hypothetical protein QNJ15_14250 [Erythrobacter sp.]|nr:hypothetical protein [Erythrobacter sp.]
MSRGPDRDALLAEDVRGIQAVLDTFPKSPNGPRRVALEAGQLVHVQRFPLPDRYAPNDEADIVLLVPNYPDHPPYGVHFLETPANRPVIRDIQSKFGHIFDHGVYDGIPRLKNHSWLCFKSTYRGRPFAWRFLHNNIHAGDTLYKYLERLHVELER